MLRLLLVLLLWLAGRGSREACGVVVAVVVLSLFWWLLLLSLLLLLVLVRSCNSLFLWLDWCIEYVTVGVLYYFV